jgi:hypothetical protein
MMALKLRATLRLGAGDFEAFRRNAMAVVRFGQVATQTPILIGKLVAIGCKALGIQAITGAATAGALSPQQCETLITDLRAIPAPSPLADVFELGERALLLDYLQLSATYGLFAAGPLMGGMGGEEKPKAIVTSAHDWDAGLRKVNGWYDRLAAVGRGATYPERRRLNEAVSRDLDALRARCAAAFMIVPVEDRMLAAYVPSTGRAYDVETRVIVEADLSVVALALRAHRVRASAYPATLAELAPRYFKTVPADRFTERALTYRREGEGYAVYSSGPNGMDDQGATGKQNDDMAGRAER